MNFVKLNLTVGNSTIFVRDYSIYNIFQGDIADGKVSVVYRNHLSDAVIEVSVQNTVEDILGQMEKINQATKGK